MFYKGDSVYLYIVDFGSEFNGFGFLASDNGAKVMPVDVWGIERSGFFNGREKWAKGFENQRV